MLFHPSERAFAQAVVELAFANPFDDAEVARHEKSALSVDLPDDVRNRGVPLTSLLHFGSGHRARPAQR